jgi:hypothetical protein
MEFSPVDKEGDRFAIHVRCEAGFTVASKAIFVFQLVLGASGEGRAQQIDRQCTEQDPAGYFHAIEETPSELSLP